MADDLATSPARVEVAVLLARMETARSGIEQAAGHATGHAAQALAAIAARLAGKESALTQALQSGSPATDIDFSAVEGLIQSSETAADTAERAEEAEAGTAANEGALAATTAATRGEVQDLAHDLYDRHLFAADLHFSSASDEAEYHKREEERQRQIAADLTRNTPEGALDAGGVEAGQMLDAGSHGATASPEFMPRWNRLVAQLDQQREAVQDEKGSKSAAAFDRQVRQDIRTFLEHEHASPAEIARVLAAKDPLQAVTPYLKADDADRLQSQLTGISAGNTSVIAQSDQTATAAGDLVQAAMTLHSAGVTAEKTPASGHGLPNQTRHTAPEQQTAHR